MQPHYDCFASIRIVQPLQNIKVVVIHRDLNRVPLLILGPLKYSSCLAPEIRRRVFGYHVRLFSYEVCNLGNVQYDVILVTRFLHLTT